MNTEKEMIPVDKDALEKLLSLVEAQNQRLDDLENRLSDIHSLVCAIGEHLHCI